MVSTVPVVPNVFQNRSGQIPLKELDDDLSYVNKKACNAQDFGAVGDYNPVTFIGTDDTDAIQAGLDYLYANGGGTLYLDPTKKYKCTKSLNVWIGVRLTCLAVSQGGFSNFGSTAWNNPPIDPTVKFTAMGGALWMCFDAGKGDGTPTYDVSSVVGLPNYATRTATINLYGELVGVKVFQFSFANAKPATYTDNATFNSAWNSGTMASVAIRQQADDAKVMQCLIGGFMQGILSYGNNRGRFVDNIFDCMNAIEVSLSLDTHFIARNVQFNLASQGYSLGSLVRRGCFLYLHDTVDWPQIVSNFTFGSKLGAYISNINFPMITDFGADNSGIETSGYAGIQFAGTVNYPMLQNINAAGREYGVYCDIGAGNTLRINGYNAVVCTQGLAVVSGDVSLAGAYLSGTGTSIGINNVGTGVVYSYDTRMAGNSSNYIGNVIEQGPRFTFKSANFGAAVGQDTVVMDCSGGTLAYTLPPASKYPNGTRHKVVRWDTVVGNLLTVSKNAADAQIVDAFGSVVSSLNAGIATTLEFESDGVSGWKLTNMLGSLSWTPTMTFVTPGDLAIASYAVRQGYILREPGGYRIRFRISIAAGQYTQTTAAGAMQITGLPFTTPNIANSYALGSIFFTGITKAGYGNYTARVDPNSNFIRIIAGGSGVTADFVQAANMPTGGIVELTGDLFISLVQ